MAAKGKAKSRKSSPRTSVKDLRIQKTNAHKVKGGMTPGPETLSGR